MPSIPLFQIAGSAIDLTEKYTANGTLQYKTHVAMLMSGAEQINLPRSAGGKTVIEVIWVTGTPVPRLTATGTDRIYGNGWDDTLADLNSKLTRIAFVEDTVGWRVAYGSPTNALTPSAGLIPSIETQVDSNRTIAGTAAPSYIYLNGNGAFTTTWDVSTAANGAFHYVKAIGGPRSFSISGMDEVVLGSNRFIQTTPYQQNLAEGETAFIHFATRPTVTNQPQSSPPTIGTPTVTAQNLNLVTVSWPITMASTGVAATALILRVFDANDTSFANPLANQTITTGIGLGASVTASFANLNGFNGATPRSFVLRAEVPIIGAYSSPKTVNIFID